MQVQPLGWEDPLEKEMATHSILHNCQAFLPGEPHRQRRLEGQGPRGAEESCTARGPNSSSEEGVLTRLLICHVSVLVKSLLKSLACFYWTIFMLLRFENSLYWIKPFVKYMICKYFVPLLACLLVPFRGFFTEQSSARWRVLFIGLLLLHTPALGQQHVVLMAVGL